MSIVNFLCQEIITKEELEQLIKNNTVSKVVINNDPKPVVKLFTPDADFTWLLIEYDPREKVFFGLCDL